MSKVMPLPTRPRTGELAAGGGRGFVAEDDEGWGFGGALRDGGEGSHFELEDFVQAVDFAGEAELFGHGGRALA